MCFRYTILTFYCFLKVVYTFNNFPCISDLIYSLIFFLLDLIIIWLVLIFIEFIQYFCIDNKNIYKIKVSCIF